MESLHNPLCGRVVHNAGSGLYLGHVYVFGALNLRSLRNVLHMRNAQSACRNGYRCR
jgi:hypothetical protein